MIDLKNGKTSDFLHKKPEKIPQPNANRAHKFRDHLHLKREVLTRTCCLLANVFFRTRAGITRAAAAAPRITQRNYLFSGSPISEKNPAP
jgi:hypothetical protein